MSQIRTKVFNYGNEKESTWPPLFGTREAGVSYWDPETQTMKEGHPPPRVKKYGEAPYVISDSMDPYYHPAAERWVESKSGLRHIDDACGTITTDKKLPPDPSNQRRLIRERHEDATKSLHRAVEMVDAGTAPLTEEVKELCAKQNEVVSAALNMDAFNVAGRKNNAKGKKYRRRRGL